MLRAFGKDADNFVIKNHGNNDLFPDLLRPAESEEIIRQKTWLTFFITVDGSRGLPVGAYKIKFIAAMPNKKLVKNSCAALPTALYYIYESIRIR